MSANGALGTGESDPESLRALNGGCHEPVWITAIEQDYYHRLFSGRSPSQLLIACDELVVDSDLGCRCSLVVEQRSSAISGEFGGPHDGVSSTATRGDTDCCWLWLGSCAPRCPTVGPKSQNTRGMQPRLDPEPVYRSLSGSNSATRRQRLNSAQHRRREPTARHRCSAQVLAEWRAACPTIRGLAAN